MLHCLELRAGYSEFRGRFNTFGLGTDIDSTELRAHTLTTDLLASADLTWYNRWTTTHFGAQIDRYNFDHALAAPSDASEIASDFDRGERATTVALYVETSAPGRTLEVRLGVRLLEAGPLAVAVWARRAHWRVSTQPGCVRGAGRYAQVMRSMRDDSRSHPAFSPTTSSPHSRGPPGSPTATMWC